jgi:hypothetical protein
MTTAIKSRRIRWAGHVTRMGIKDAYKIVAGKKKTTQNT